jgi:hypothetical protein
LLKDPVEHRWLFGDLARHQPAGTGHQKLLAVP